MLSSKPPRHNETWTCLFQWTGTIFNTRTPEITLYSNCASMTWTRILQTKHITTYRHQIVVERFETYAWDSSVFHDLLWTLMENLLLWTESNSALTWSTGVVRTAFPDLDREMQDRYLLVIQAKDSIGQMGGLSGTTSVTVILTDVNDNPPHFLHSEHKMIQSRHTHRVKLPVNLTVAGGSGPRNWAVRAHFYKIQQSEIKTSKPIRPWTFCGVMLSDYSSLGLMAGCWE